MPVIPDNGDRISAKIIRHAEIMGKGDLIEVFVNVSMFGKPLETLPVVNQTS